MTLDCLLGSALSSIWLSISCSDAMVCWMGASLFFVSFTSCWELNVWLEACCSSFFLSFFFIFPGASFRWRVACALFHFFFVHFVYVFFVSCGFCLTTSTVAPPLSTYGARTSFLHEYIMCLSSKHLEQSTLYSSFGVWDCTMMPYLFGPMNSYFSVRYFTTLCVTLACQLRTWVPLCFNLMVLWLLCSTFLPIWR